MFRRNLLPPSSRCKYLLLDEDGISSIFLNISKYLLSRLNDISSSWKITNLQSHCCEILKSHVHDVRPPKRTTVNEKSDVCQSLKCSMYNFFWVNSMEVSPWEAITCSEELPNILLKPKSPFLCPQKPTTDPYNKLD